MKNPREIFHNYLKNNGIRKSNQRYHILDEFLNTEGHLTATEIFDIVKEKHKDIGIATIYRTMKIICKAGLAEEVDFSDGAKRFEHKYGHNHHDHLICLECGKKIEVMDLKIERLQKNLVKRYKFTSMRHKMQIFGICCKCKDKNK